ncbi:MAG TPA: sulfatase-like hydrolase/transferase [Terracidiphilus sp.]|nr:sulfatase-like hydrolase/transferase [Terracidiphilus sp.]
MESKLTTGIDRRRFVKGAAGTLAASAVSSLSAQAGGHPSRGRAPNVILMICDDLGSGDLHCYGSSLKTPNLDRMAGEGARFTHFNTAHPICSASRAALLTGRYSSRTHTQGAYGPSSKEGTDLEEKTLADILKTAGYKSMAIGKWHLGYPPPYLPTNRGFDSYYGVPWSVDMAPLPLLRDTNVAEADANREMLTPLYTEEAVKFIDASSSASSPFFLYVAFSYPHDPPTGSPRFRGHSGLGRQGDAIEEIDWSVGEILNAVHRQGLERDTLIFFTSDHGPWFQGCPGPRRGRKSTGFEGGVRIPFIARWTGTLPAGSVIDEWGSNLDVVPTVTSICGAKPSPNPLDGQDISALLTGKTDRLDRGTLLYFAVSPDQQVLECARKGNWKLRISQRTGEIYINDWLGGSCGPERHFVLPHPELYNLELDPAESYDAAVDYPEKIKEIERDIAALIATFPENVQKAYAEMKANPGSHFTPAEASTRPGDLNAPNWIYIPPWRRDTGNLR